MRVVEADQSPIAGIVHSQRVFNTVRTPRSGSYAPDFKLYPISGGLIDYVDVSVQIEQVLKRMVLLRSMSFHNRILSVYDNNEKDGLGNQTEDHGAAMKIRTRWFTSVPKRGGLPIDQTLSRLKSST